MKKQIITFALTAALLMSSVTVNAASILNDKSIVADIAEACYLSQNKENTALIGMKSRLQQTEKEIDNIISAIKQGIITNTITETLKNLETEKEQLQTAILQEQIERPIMSKEEIKYWLHRFSLMNCKNENEMQILIKTFVNSIYVYDDKILIMFNYRDGERCVDAEEIKKYMHKKENSDNHRDYQSSPFSVFGGPSRTRIDFGRFGIFFHIAVSRIITCFFQVRLAVKYSNI